MQGHRQFGGDQLRHRHFQAHRFTEIARQHALDPEQVLDGDGLVEMVLGADLRDHRRIIVFARHDHGGIARQQMLQGKNDHRHEKHRGQKLDEAFADQREHSIVCLRILSNTGMDPSGSTPVMAYLSLAPVRRIRPSASCL